MGILLEEGIGDTMRLSLTADPLEEVRVAWDLLSALGMRRLHPELVSCPTCGRCQVSLIDMAEEVQRRLASVEAPISVAVMGCVVNGPGEARDADLGVACGHGQGVLFENGKKIRDVPEMRYCRRASSVSASRRPAASRRLARLAARMDALLYLYRRDAAGVLLRVRLFGVPTPERKLGLAVHRQSFHGRRNWFAAHPAATGPQRPRRTGLFVAVAVGERRGLGMSRFDTLLRVTAVALCCAVAAASFVKDGATLPAVASPCRRPPRGRRGAGRLVDRKSVV